MPNPNNDQSATDDRRQSEFDRVRSRLEEIARAVDDDSISLDDALDLYEEAVTLGLKASDLLEVDVDVDDGAVESAQDADWCHQPEAAGSQGAGDGGRATQE